MSDPTALVAELLALSSPERVKHGVPQDVAMAKAAALIAQQAATIAARDDELIGERWHADEAARQRDVAKAALTAAEAERDRLARTIGHCDRRIARLVEAMEFARSKGVVFPADSEPPVVLSDSDAAHSPETSLCPHAPTYDAGLCCGYVAALLAPL